MFDLLGLVSSVFSYDCDSYSYDDDSSIDDWMAYSSVPIVAGTEDIGSMFHDDNSGCETEI